ncbi:MAG TPA: GntR family transcriptional regulator [Propionibacteriaceae bacterium]|nr:GntR family transcriptional regulator [Micropruina sp.]HBY24356.1 GntR family transcriptional regulator [Propionibacteriaceae bacterium]
MAEDERIHDGPLPKHRQLRELLIEMAVPGQAIPSERELMATYEVSRATVRKAIDGLVADGLLQRTHGLGTFAVRARLETNLHLASFSQDMLRRGLTPSTRLLSLGLALPPAEVATWFGLAPGERAWRLARIRLADDAPIAHEEGWYSTSLLPGLDRHNLTTESLYDILANSYGYWVDHAEQVLWGEAADALLANQLSAPVGTPLLVFQRRSTAGGKRLEYVVSRYRGDRYQVHMDLTREQPANELNTTPLERNASDL